jgi:hypothetical protein
MTMVKTSTVTAQMTTGATTMEVTMTEAMRVAVTKGSRSACSKPLRFLAKTRSHRLVGAHPRICGQEHERK